MAVSLPELHIRGDDIIERPKGKRMGPEIGTASKSFQASLACGQPS